MAVPVVVPVGEIGEDCLSFRDPAAPCKGSVSSLLGTFPNSLDASADSQSSHPLRLQDPERARPGRIRAGMAAERMMERSEKRVIGSTAFVFPGLQMFSCEVVLQKRPGIYPLSAVSRSTLPTFRSGTRVRIWPQRLRRWRRAVDRFAEIRVPLPCLPVGLMKRPAKIGLLLPQ